MRIRRAAGLFAVVSLLGLGSASAAAAQGTLDLEWGDTYNRYIVYSATLTCSPNGNWSTQDYHDADRACAEIAQAGGDFTRLPRRTTNCSAWVGWPIGLRMKATGTWNGNPVRYDVLHPNRCEAFKATGQVFVW